MIITMQTAKQNAQQFPTAQTRSLAEVDLFPLDALPDIFHAFFRPALGPGGSGRVD